MHSGKSLHRSIVQVIEQKVSKVKISSVILNVSFKTTEKDEKKREKDKIQEQVI